MPDSPSVRISRRTLLSSVGIAIVATATSASARSLSGALPWQAFSADPPDMVKSVGWTYFRPEEARAIEAIVDRLIPADDLSIGGKDAGCAVYIDRQLAGDFGDSARLYMKGPFKPGTPTQGYQKDETPAMRYRAGLTALDAWVKQNKDGKSFAELSPEDQDALLKDMEAGKVELPNGVDAKAFFTLVLGNTMEGFFADPIYGGNRDMVSWRMLGFPGARYDYRDHVSKHNQPYPLPPVSIAGAPEWMGKKG